MIDSQFEALKKAREWGFKVPDSASLAHSIDEVFEFITEWDEKRKSLPYEIEWNCNQSKSIKSAK